MSTVLTPRRDPSARRDHSSLTARRITKSLLGYGVLAGPVMVTASLVQATTREGFDLTRHQWSLLANGDLGWIQVTNFVVTGLMVVACAVGLARSLTEADRGEAGAAVATSAGVGRAAPRLLAAYGLSLVVAGVLRADPALGFPVGTPDGAGPISWHGIGHFTSGGLGFVAVALGALTLARRYAAQGRRGRALHCRVTAVAFPHRLCHDCLRSGRERGDPRLHRSCDPRMVLARRRSSRPLPGRG